MFVGCFIFICYKATSFFPVLPGRRRRWMAAEFCPGTLGCWHFNKNGWFPKKSMVDIEDFEHVVVISLDRKASDYNNILWGATTLPKLPNPPGRRFSKLLAITMFQLQLGRIHVLQSHSWQAPRKWWNKTLPYVKLCVSWKPGAFGAGLFLVYLFI